MRKILFCNVAYLPYYDTTRDNINPVNGGSYVADNQDALEKHNFEECSDGLYRGFVETKHYLGYKVGVETNTFNTLHIERIDASAKNKGYVQNVLVVFCAKPQNGKTVIVGWYNNATVFRGRPEYNGRAYNLRTDVCNACLLPENERTFEIPRANNEGVGFGQSNVWYADTPESEEIINKVINYITNYQTREA